MQVFDAHVHVFPDRIADATVRQLGEVAGVTPSFDGTRAGLVAEMARNGIDGGLNCPVATKPEQVDTVNCWAAHHNRAPVFSLGSIHPDSEAPETILRRVRDAGLHGIKMHPEYQAFHLDDSRFRRIASVCRELKLLILLHCGGDVGYRPPYHSSPAAVRTLIRDLPGLTVVAAHFGGWRMWDEVEAELIGEPVYLDTAFTLEFLQPDRLAALVRRHGAHRVLFGSDAPWGDQARCLELFEDLPLAEEERRQILWHNAARLLDAPSRQNPA